jgi:HSP20 family molecular chaperone IbpA
MNVAIDKITSTLKDGILTIILPPEENDKHSISRISIQ